MVATNAHYFHDGLGFFHLKELRIREKLESGAQAPNIGQCDGPGCGLTHHIAAKFNELLVKGQLPKNTSVSHGGLEVGCMLNNK